MPKSAHLLQVCIHHDHANDDHDDHDKRIVTIFGF